MCADREVAESYPSIDESDYQCPTLDDVKIQRDWKQLPQTLTQNLLAGRQKLLNGVLPGLLCLQSNMSQQKQEDTSVSDQLGSCLPAFDQLGVETFLSLPGKDAGRIETNTSEYYSAENGETSSGNSDENSTENNNFGLDEGSKREEQGKKRISSVSMSSENEEIQTKRASLVKSKEWYSSIEYDPARRNSIPVLAHGDSVFSEEVPPQPRRKCSRERLVKQRSQSTSDLPDLIQSSPVPSPQSPDVVPCFDHLRKRVHSEEILVELTESHPEFINETFERKQEIEGAVHDGTVRKPCFRRSVSFQESPIVYSIPSQDKPEKGEADFDKPLLSPHGEECRQHFRELKDSGYTTGSSSKGSLQSQLSDQTNFSDSVLTDNSSVDKEDMEERTSLHDEDSMPTLTNAGPVPNLSIFGSYRDEIASGQARSPSVVSKSLYEDGLGDRQNCEIVPNLSIFKQSDEGSNASLCLRSGEFSSSLGTSQSAQIDVAELPSDLSQGDNSPLEAHNKYAGEILEAKIEQGASAYCVPHGRSEGCGKRSLTKEKGLQQQPSRELFEYYISQMEDPGDENALLAVLEKLHIPSDSSTPSPIPHDIMQNRLLASMLEMFSVQSPTDKRADSTQCNIPEKVVVNEKLKEWLERASRCQYIKCDDFDCKKAKSLLEGFDRCMQSNSTLDKDQESVLVALRCHSERCEDIKCSVPYCAVLGQIDPWDRSEAICRIREKLGILLDLTDPESQNGRFLALSPDCRHKGPMREGEEWIALSPLGNSRNVALISDLTHASGSPVYSVLKVMPLLEDNHQWCVYEQLRRLTHPNLIQHLWVMEHGRDLLICTQFMGDGSLRHELQERQTSLPWEKVVSYMKQIITGVLALHQMGIVYINWTSCNILLGGAKRVAKVSNLAMSVRLGGENVDYGGIKNALPPAILPPELLAFSPSIYPVSDSWGCGCLLYELLLGRKVWYQYRHETKDFIWRQLQGRVPPMPRDLIQWPEVFQACWQPDFRQRHPLNHVSQMLDLTLSKSHS